MPHRKMVIGVQMALLTVNIMHDMRGAKRDIRHSPGVGDISLNGDSGIICLGQGRAPVPEGNDIDLLRSLNQTSTEDPLLDWRTAFIAEVEREEDRATGRCRGVDSTSHILNPAPMVRVGFEMSHADDQESETV